MDQWRPKHKHAGGAPVFAVANRAGSSRGLNFMNINNAVRRAPPHWVGRLLFLGLILGIAVMSLTERGRADLLSSRPSEDTIRAATAQCSLATRTPERGAIGISDPNTLDPGVIDLIRQTGVKWVRAEFHWSRIQPQPGGAYNWGPYDAMVAGFNAAGIRVQAILTYIPEAQLTDWGRIGVGFDEFASAVVRRYAARGVHYWEVFNEPNLPGYGWLTKKEDAGAYLGAYTLLLARANRIVRRHDPRGFVILGGIASDQHRGLAAEATMNVLYGLGAQRCFDIFAYHPYGYQNRFPEARARIDKLLRRHGDAAKPVWFNEYGWTDQASMDMARNMGAENPMIAAFRQAGVADAFFWFAAKDYSRRRGTPTFGLATYELKKRPSFETFRAIIARIGELRQ